jgi:hypothetical protein
MFERKRLRKAIYDLRNSFSHQACHVLAFLADKEKLSLDDAPLAKLIQSTRLFKTKFVDLTVVTFPVIESFPGDVTVQACTSTRTAS